MNVDQPALLMGLAAGGLGGTLSALNVLFGGFRSLRDIPSSNAARHVRARAAFFTARLVAGAIAGFAVTFLLLSDFESGHLPASKLAFAEILAGFGGAEFIRRFSLRR